MARRYHSNCRRAKRMIICGVFSIQPQLLEATPNAVICAIKPKQHVDAKFNILGYGDTGEHLATLASDQYHRFLNAQGTYIPTSHGFGVELTQRQSTMYCIGKNPIRYAFWSIANADSFRHFWHAPC
ncbi:hypothetical protein A1F96_03352 [Pyrenophora tritici-repentis]|uniref:Uncharacterized protein n=2 Tax=Pyrenophora tritici-repentis TaxID=45151 RepID=A0A922SY37_9PLEO|nr:uncharacterized protein PTRG_04595 [Pyrenophora tritici-repentis Pt-1C-BFP]KAI1511093.1 hypothetical protein Ptr86124_010214 [Pyrenophora tritici-repentis]EDU47502.1 predicted protein [Pyrenophora tritici-repentis Pt-1C-BFP]KAI1668180.1 hypothetical protein L13192_07316 [Pyrenophora tritici-repentis]KAI1681099.1 hypothetical protein KJE20_09950 [Pyrenophora tritici-repentis]PZD31781.1 hypothetical protein A1F96_03352 [Pyrenophora tritici-repentis]